MRTQTHTLDKVSVELWIHLYVYIYKKHNKNQKIQKQSVNRVIDPPR